MITSSMLSFFTNSCQSLKIKSVNRTILEKASGSVEILIPYIHPALYLHWITSCYSMCVVFYGGPDDREALALGDAHDLVTLPSTRLRRWVCEKFGQRFFFPFQNIIIPNFPIHMLCKTTDRKTYYLLLQYCIGTFILLYIFEWTLI